jgi:hypothetical protein
MLVHVIKQGVNTALKGRPDTVYTLKGFLKTVLSGLVNIEEAIMDPENT